LHLPAEKGRNTLARFTPLVKDIAAEVLASLDETDVADVLSKLLLIKNNIREASAKRGAGTRSHGKWRQGYP